MPYVCVQVDISDIDSADMVKELETRGYTVSRAGGPVATLDGLDRIEHLALCGLMRDAQAEALSLVGDAIGRRLN